MYCIECGAQIPENSKFCPHCGKKQIEGEPTIKEKIVEEIIEKEVDRKKIEAVKESFDFQFLRKSMGWYLAWVLLHLALLLIGSEGVFDSSKMGSDDFWPFNYKSKLREYDISEFLVYTIFPFAILVIRGLIKSDDQKPKDNEAA
jgi:hypothetical protein